LELYAQAVSAGQQKAHKKVDQMVLPAKFPEKLKARSAASTAWKPFWLAEGARNQPCRNPTSTLKSW
jgi:hypothetical protein